MFRLTEVEWKSILSSQIVMMDDLPKNRSGKYLPYAFTEHGVTMLASVVKSKKARMMNIAIVRAFVALRKFVIQHSGMVAQLAELEKQVGNHDTQLNQIYTATETLLEQKKEEQDWKENRERIGFKK